MSDRAQVQARQAVWESRRQWNLMRLAELENATADVTARPASRYDFHSNSLTLSR
jgi:hypothetical protein